MPFASSQSIDQARKKLTPQELSAAMVRHRAFLSRQSGGARAVFKLLWDTIGQGQEIFAYVLNLAADGAHYWVFAHVTPSRDAAGRHVGYHSNRRKPDPAQIERIKPIYKALCAEEARHANAKDGMHASFEAMIGLLKQQGVGYDEFVLSL